MTGAAPNTRRAGKRASGKVLVRMPIELHELLLVEAERQGVSANLLASSLLAAGLRWRAPTTEEGASK